MTGRVWIVGAGPGDPKLVTVKGAECLRQADVVVYDRLIAAELLEYAPPCALRIYAGKSSHNHSLTQDEINALLVAHAREGKTVVRLKGGDPFVFGRGGEEALALAEAGIPFEIVPGVSSAIAAAAYAGIPVTHRGVATSFAVMTGHREQRAPQDTCDTSVADTLVFLMGVENLVKIVSGMLDSGCDPALPAALVRWGSTRQQKTIVGTLGDIVGRAQGLEPPAVLIVGEVVRLRAKLNWFPDGA